MELQTLREKWTLLPQIIQDDPASAGLGVSQEVASLTSSFEEAKKSSKNYEVRVQSLEELSSSLTEERNKYKTMCTEQKSTLQSLQLKFSDRKKRVVEVERSEKKVLERAASAEAQVVELEERIQDIEAVMARQTKEGFKTAFEAGMEFMEKEYRLEIEERVLQIEKKINSEQMVSSPACGFKLNDFKRTLSVYEMRAILTLTLTLTLIGR